MSKVLGPKTHTPVVTSKDLQYLETNRLLKQSKRNSTKITRQKRTNNPSAPKESQKRKTSEEKPKRKTFKQTILRLLKEKGKPLKREQLVTKAIEENPPKSQRPE